MVRRGSNVGGDVPNANSIGEGVTDSWVVAEKYVGEYLEWWSRVVVVIISGGR